MQWSYKHPIKELIRRNRTSKILNRKGVGKGRSVENTVYVIRECLKVLKPLTIVEKKSQ